MKTDSLLQFSKDTNHATSLFNNHLLAVKTVSSKIHYSKPDYLSGGIMLFVFILFAWLYVSNRKRLNQIIKGFYFSRFASQLGREEFSFGSKISVILFTLFVLVLSLFVSKTISYFGWLNFSNNQVYLYVATALFVTFIYLVKLIVVRLTGFLFQIQPVTNEYRITVLLFCNTLALIMMPLVLCLFFMKQVSPGLLINIGFSIIFLFILIRIIRGLVIGLNSSKVSAIYLFLYLFTLELLPFVIMVKFAVLKC